jgi:hypothetical protein
MLHCPGVSHDAATAATQQCPTTEAGLVKGVADDALLEVQGLVLAVMAEKAAGKRSVWAPYLRFIPDDLSHMPMYWEVRSRCAGSDGGCDDMTGLCMCEGAVTDQVAIHSHLLVEPGV